MQAAILPAAGRVRKRMKMEYLSGQHAELFFRAAAKAAASAYGTADGEATFVCPLCRQEARIWRNARGGMAYCRHCGVAISRK